MSKKILTSAKNLASLDLLISQKKAGKEYSPEELWIIVIIIFGGGVHIPPGLHINDDIPQYQMFEKVSNALINVVKHASVEELMQFRSNVAVER